MCFFRCGFVTEVDLICRQGFGVELAEVLFCCSPLKKRPLPAQESTHMPSNREAVVVIYADAPVLQFEGVC